MCVAAALANALGIGAEILFDLTLKSLFALRVFKGKKIAAYSPCRRQCPNTNNPSRTKNSVARSKLLDSSFINPIANFTNRDDGFTNHLAKIKN